MSELDNGVNGTRNWFVENKLYFLAYAVWFISGALITLPLLYAPPAISSVLQKLDATRWAISAVQRFGFVGLGLMWLIAILLSEHYLRTSAGNGEMRTAVARVARITGIILAITFAIYFLPALIEIYIVPLFGGSP